MCFYSPSRNLLDLSVLGCLLLVVFCFYRKDFFVFEAKVAEVFAVNAQIWLGFDAKVAKFFAKVAVVVVNLTQGSQRFL